MPVSLLRRCLLSSISLALILLPSRLMPQAIPRRAPSRAEAEQATAHYLASIQQQPLLLLAFLRDLPKGADLHNHLSGAISAETFLGWAVRDGRCLDLRTFTVVAPPCDAAQGRLPAADADHDDMLYREIIDAWSMRDFVPSSAESGHDHFFDAFGKYGLADQGHTGDMLAAVMHNAAGQHLLYLELMNTFAHKASSALARRAGWDPDFARLRSKMMPGIPAVLASAGRELDAAEKQMNTDLRCGTPAADPGCQVQARFIDQVLRGMPPQEVFAEMLTGFELASHDPRMAGLNLVMPEDGYVSMRDFRLQMSMLGYLHGIYPTVHISLHAGELAPGMVPPDGLRFHIRASVEQGHAERVGHGVDIMEEDRPFQLLDELAQRHVLVEICLTSNKVILGISGKHHPLPIYLAHHVPVALATDDAGVSRSTLSREFLLAEEEYHLPYATLKRMVRDSLDHAFLPGPSLWRAPEDFHPVAACAHDTLGSPSPDAACATWLKASEKARLEWQEEAELQRFEHRVATEIAAPDRVVSPATESSDISTDITDRLCPSLLSFRSWMPLHSRTFLPPCTSLSAAPLPWQPCAI